MGSKTAETLKLKYIGLVASGGFYLHLLQLQKISSVKAEELCILMPVG